MEAMKGHEITVAMYCPFFFPSYGGAELAAFNLAKELRMWCDVKFYTFNWTQDLDVNRNYKLNFSSGFPEYELVNGVEVYRYPVANLPVVKNFSLKLIKDIKFDDADILHIQGATRLFSRLLLQRILKNRIKILTTHGLQESAEIIRRNRLNVLINSVFMHSLKNLDCIIALSSTDVNLLLHLGINRKKISLIPNGIDEAKFENRRKFVERNKKIKILCVARFDRNKNYESLVYALSKLKNDLEFEAYFIGAVTNRQYFKEIMKLVKVSGLEKSVTIGTSLDDSALTDCYLSCDLFVLPSSMETSPLAILEAMYAGLPIVATNVGNMSEMVRNGVNGFLVPPKNPFELYKKCLELLKNEELRNEMRNANKELAKKFTWSKIASLTYNLYQQLIEKDMRS